MTATAAKLSSDRVAPPANRGSRYTTHANHAADAFSAFMYRAGRLAAMTTPRLPINATPSHPMAHKRSSTTSDSTGARPKHWSTTRHPDGEGERVA